VTGNTKVPNATDVWELVLKKEAETRQQEAEKERRREQAVARREKARRRQEKQRGVAFEELGNLVEGLRNLNLFVRSSKIRLSDRSDISWHCSSPQHSDSASRWIVEFGGLPAVDGRISLRTTSSGLPDAELHLSRSAVPAIRVVLGVIHSNAKLKYMFERLECAAVLLPESATVPTQIDLTWHHDFKSAQLADIHGLDFPVPDWDEIVPDHSWKAVNSSRFNYLVRQYQSALLTTEFSRAIDEEFPLSKWDEALRLPAQYTPTNKFSTESMVEIAEEVYRQVKLYLESELGEVSGQAFEEVPSVIKAQRRRFDEFISGCQNGYLSLVNHLASLPPAEVPRRLQEILRYPVLNKKNRIFELCATAVVASYGKHRARFARAVATFEAVDYVELVSDGLVIYHSDADQDALDRIKRYCEKNGLSPTLLASSPRERSFRPSDKKSQRIYDDLVARAKLVKTAEEREHLAREAGFNGLLGLADAISRGQLKDL
jgi:hypothetical protein